MIGDPHSFPLLSAHDDTSVYGFGALQKLVDSQNNKMPMLIPDLNVIPDQLQFYRKRVFGPLGHVR